MQPFRVHDQKEKTTWVVVNYHPSKDTYLAYRQKEDADDDGILTEIAKKDLVGCRMIDFIYDGD